MNLDVTAIILSLLVLTAQIYNAWMQKHQSPAQKDKDVIDNYGRLIVEYRTKIDENLKEIERLEDEERADREAHDIELRNLAAIAQKAKIEYEQEMLRVKKDRDAYAIAYAGVRRIAVKYVPPDVVLPEVNGNTKDLK